MHNDQYDELFEKMENLSEQKERFQAFKIVGADRWIIFDMKLTKGGLNQLPFGTVGPASKREILTHPGKDIERVLANKNLLHGK